MVKIFKKDTTSDDAYDFIKKGANKRLVWKKFSASCDKKVEEKPFTYFMAGAPGSGKTELIKKHLAHILDNCIVADADEIRNLLPQYDGKNSHKVQRAASKGVDVLYDNSLKRKYNIIVDGTFSLSYKKCRENIARSLNKNRPVGIIYLYTDPKVAWTYAKKREYTEGRKIRIRTFVKSFFKSRDNINKIKNEFGKEVYISGIRSNYGNIGEKSEVRADIASVDEIKKIDYNYLSLWMIILYANILLQIDRLWKKIRKITKK